MSTVRRQLCRAQSVDCEHKTDRDGVSPPPSSSLRKKKRRNRERSNKNLSSHSDDGQVNQCSLLLLLPPPPPPTVVCSQPKSRICQLVNIPKPPLPPLFGLLAGHSKKKNRNEGKRGTFSRTSRWLAYCVVDPGPSRILGKNSGFCVSTEKKIYPYPLPQKSNLGSTKVSTSLSREQNVIIRNSVGEGKARTDHSHGRLMRSCHIKKKKKGPTSCVSSRLFRSLEPPHRVFSAGPGIWNVDRHPSVDRYGGGN